MEFNTNKPIYLQIAFMICEKILLKQFQPDERIPSIREMAIQLEVNPNTIMRTYEFLQGLEIISNKRGVGYYVVTDGVQKATSYRKTEFLKEDLPQLFKTASLLEINFDELKEQYLTYQAFKK